VTSLRRFIPALALAFVLPAADAFGDAQPVPDEVTGVWERKVATPQGEFRMVKTHAEGKTTLTTRDPAGNVVEAKTSEYRLKETEVVRIFTYSNNTITAGPNAGVAVPGEFAYLYRIEGDRFYEIRGVLKGDKDPFAVLVWERVKP
jgi:hypothetical protein